MIETAEHRLKKLRMRSWRRGIKEMDLILGAYADAKLADLDPTTLDTYDAMLSENDHDLYQWVTGQVSTPPQYLNLITVISRHAGIGA
ncbi:FAD assembly factor SdhE [Pseudogemmobacter sp. W21_MBD1_M6]|jgi:antitoxin CptB|uniref:FAD assembly factor SdhE n=1 Tax=Pseudogemmobacter sp. W21_MBD1_M6 TaxID=3240271 RepID=UPI003F95BBC0